LPYVWIPVGLLDDDAGLRLVAHLSLASKAKWDLSIAEGQCFQELPSDLLAFINTLQSDE